MQIKRIDNGWILNCDGHEVVYEIRDDFKDQRQEELRALTDLLIDIAELVGPSYDGFSKYNIKIGNVKGDEI